jgi:formylglycine-generating enzyme required for sulfatase activity
MNSGDPGSILVWSAQSNKSWIQLVPETGYAGNPNDVSRVVVAITPGLLADSGIVTVSAAGLSSQQVRINYTPSGGSAAGSPGARAAGTTAKFGGIDFVWCPPGTFKMGSFMGALNEEPVHEVTLTHGFWLAKYEITVDVWNRVMAVPGHSGVEGSQPEVCVSWNETQQFLARLNALAPENGFRLPTEAEWEYACRAGTTTEYSFGDNEGLMSEYGNAGPAGLMAVGQFQPNAWGLYDMHGNAWEWVEDWYAPYVQGPQADPTGPSTGFCRVRRGGSCQERNAQYARSANRDYYPPEFQFNSTGLRIARPE